MPYSEVITNEKHYLSDIFDDLCVDQNDENITLETILHNLNNRGYAPLLIVPSLIILSPVGAIPGVPAILGLFIFFVAFQMMLGRSEPWLPSFVKKLKFETKSFCSGLEKSEPILKKIERVIKPRYCFLATNKLAYFFVSIMSVILSMGVVSIGFIPFLPDLLVLPILFFSIGLLTQDGIVIILGMIALLIALTVLPLIIF